MWYGGSVTVLGDEASLDVSVMDDKGKVWQRASKSAVNNLIGGLQSTADAINSDVFGRPVAAAAQPGSSGGGRAHESRLCGE